MTLTAKQKALGATLSLFLLSVVLAYTVKFIAENVTTEQILKVVSAGIFGFLFYTMYSLFLLKFKADEETNP